MDASRGLWGALGGAGLVAGVVAFFALKAAPPPPPVDAAVSICAVPRHHDCSFYATCIESNVSCGPTGYALGFGEKYCQRFADAPLSPTGVAWADSVMICLERSLLPYDKPDRKSASCDEISEAAFGAHPACYTALPASICFLPPADVLAVFDTIGADEVFAARTRAQIQAVIATCTVQVADRAVALAAGTNSLVLEPERGGLGAAGDLWKQLAAKYEVAPNQGIRR
jgi:hypothetical protein